jgi:hypothetical protein
MHQCRALLTAIVIIGSASLLTPSTASADPDPGLIGQRYVGADLTYAHYHSSRYDHTWGGAADINLPVAPGYDVAFAYDPTHLTGPGYSRYDHSLAATALAYNRDDYGKAFFSATLGQMWDTTRLLSASYHNDATFWALGTGVEAALNATTAINYHIGYRRSFHGGDLSPTWRFGVQADHWFTGQWAGVVSADYDMVRHAPDALVYTAGARFRF